MALPYPTKVVLPFDIATAQDMNERHANDVALAAGTGLDDDAVTTAKIEDEAVTAEKINTSTFSYVLAQRTSTQSISTATGTVIVYNNEITDTLGEYNNSNGVFTCSSPGLYAVSAKMRYQQATNATINTISIRVNGSSVLEDNNPNSLATFTGRQVDGLIRLADAGDTIDISVYQNTGGSRTIDSNAGSCNLTIARIA